MSAQFDRMRRCLAPDDLAGVAAAFEAGLAAATEELGLHPHTFRQQLARHVIGLALRGEVDPHTLETAAIQFTEHLCGESPLTGPARSAKGSCTWHRSA
jgi:hypothetical protein